LAHIKFENVSVEFSIFDVKSRSLKNKLVNIATGGLLRQDTGNSYHIKALSNVTFDIEDGDRVGIVGHNGAGKSTLLRTINKIYVPTSGCARIDGETSSLIDISLGIDPDATGRENVFIRGALLGLKKDFIEEKLDEVIQFSELGDYINVPVRTYSSGMHMRLAFAVSTLVTPEILIMDEWLSVGDQAFQNKAEMRLKKLIGSANILILASHNVNMLRDVCNKIVWLEHGSLKDIGPADEVISKFFSSGN
jgi:lipopolysaccharide transport system ATP-binding protein